MTAPLPFDVRNLFFTLDAKTRPRYWHGGRKAVTAYWDSLSAFFPHGEKFFVDSVNAHRAHVTDPALASAVRAFTAQEGFHRREHARYNQLLSDHGYPLVAMELRVERLLKRVRWVLPKRWQLAVTVALEHFTSLLGTLVLSDPYALEGADPVMASLWRWHSLEENEHKAVAFDVYQAAGGHWAERCFVMVLTTLVFWGKVVEQQTRMMASNGSLWQPREWVDLMRFVFIGREGGLGRLLPQYLDYFRPSFHPMRAHDLAQIDQWRAQTLPSLPVPAQRG